MLLLSLRLRIEGSNILLTGASSGIGAALAEELAKRGARLALVARRPSKPVPGGVSIRADLSRPEDRERAVEEALSALGSVDILINNAGVGVYAPSWKMAPELMRSMFEVNLFAAVDLTQRLAPAMIGRRSGMVVNISSIASKVPLPWFTLYSATKAALEAFTRGFRMEVKRTGVKAMLVCPGYVKTNFQASVLGGVPPARLVSGRKFATTSEEVARAVAEGIERDARTVMTPAAFGWAFVAASRVAPGLVDRQLESMLERDGDE